MYAIVDDHDSIYLVSLISIEIHNLAPVFAILSFFIILASAKIFFYGKITRTFGPLIQIIFAMITDLAKFLTAIMLILIMFSCIALANFNNIPGFKTLLGAFITLFETSTGNYDYEPLK